jgi:hypothetical protein
MTMRRALTLVLTALAFHAGGLAAQVCLGRPALGANSVANVGAGVSFFDGGEGYGARAGFGGRLFGLAAFDYYDPDAEVDVGVGGAEFDVSLKSVSGGAGYDVTSGTSVSVCPGVVATYAFGLEILGVDFTALEIAPGVAVGMQADLSPTVSVAPFGQVAFAYTRGTIDAGPFGEVTEDETAGLLAAGISLIFNDRISVGPSVLMPIARGEDDQAEDDTLVSVFFSVALPR